MDQLQAHVINCRAIRDEQQRIHGPSRWAQKRLQAAVAACLALEVNQRQYCLPWGAV